MRIRKMKIRIRKMIFIEDNMTRDEEFLSNKIHISIDVMINRQPNVDMGIGERREERVCLVQSRQFWGSRGT